MKPSLLTKIVPDIRLYYGKHIPNKIAEAFDIKKTDIRDIIRLRKGKLDNEEFVYAIKNFVDSLVILNEAWLLHNLPVDSMFVDRWEVCNNHNNFTCINIVQVAKYKVKLLIRVPKLNPKEFEIYFMTGSSKAVFNKIRDLNIRSDIRQLVLEMLNRL